MVQSPCSDFIPKKLKSVSASTSPFYLTWSDGIRSYDLRFLNVKFQASFFTLLFHPYQDTNSSLLSAIRVVSYTYMKFLIFLPAVLITACDSSSLTFHMMYFAFKLDKQDDNIQPCHTPFPILNQSIVPCPVLTVCFLTYTQVSQESGKVVWYYSLRISHSLLWFTMSKALP